MSISLKDTANITTANWGTARNIQIGNTAKSVNGSANVSWSLSEIGAMGATNANGYWGLTAPDGNTSNWIRTTTSGIIPHQSGGASALGTSSWPFSNAYINTVYGNLSGNASTATKLQTARTINGTSFDGSANITTANWGTARNITIGNTTKSVNGSGNVSWNLSEIGAAASNHTHSSLTGTTSSTIAPSTGTGVVRYDYNVSSANAGTLPCSNNANGILTINTHSGNYYSQLGFSSNGNLYYRAFNGAALDTTTAWKQVAFTNSSITGNASTATKLQTARSINGTNFDGTGNITTSNWGTARNIQIGNTSKSVNGSGNVSWSLSEIGAAASNHTHTSLNGINLDGVTASLNDYNLSGGGGSQKFVCYFCPSNGGGANITGRPNDNSKEAFNLIVESLRYINSTDYITKQTYTQGTQKIMYVRYCTNGTWTAWEKVYTSAQKPTASEIGAAAASHTHNYAGSSSAGGNANAAVKLATARTINGTNFDGSANITTANWGTARTLTIGNTGKSVNGSGNVSWTLDEIGARTRIKKVIDLSNTKTYSVDKWYPCLAGIPYDGMHDIEVAVQLNSGVKPSWSTHQSGFTCNLHVKAIAGGWGTTSAHSIVLNHSYSFASANPCSYSQLTNSSNAVLWLRGGGKYFVFTDWNASWSVKTASTEISSQTVAPATSCPSIALTKSTMIADLSGNASTATKLQTTRTINGTNFDGTGNITTANWGTARNIQIGNTAKSVNGSANVTWTLGDIGAAAANHTHGLINLNSEAFSGGNDLNTYNSTKTWVARTLNSTTNRPADYFTVVNFGASANSNFQLAHSYANSSTLYVRGRHDTSGNYTPWAKIYTDKNKPTASDIGAAPSSSTSLKTTDKTIVGAINEVFQSGNSVKQNLVDTLIAKGAENISTSNSWDSLIDMIEGSNISLAPASFTVEKVSGSTYGFRLLGSGPYYESENKGINGSYAMCKLNIVCNSNYDVYLDCISYGEDNYDYGIISEINTPLSLSYQADTTGVLKSFKGLSSPGVQSVRLSPESGFYYIKYIKDSSQSSGNDSLRFAVRFQKKTGGNPGGNPGNPGGEGTILFSPTIGGDNRSLTGGYTHLRQDSDSYLIYDASCIDFCAQSNTRGNTLETVLSENRINLTNYSRLRIKAYVTTSTNDSGGAPYVGFDAIGNRDEAFAASTIITSSAQRYYDLDISGLTGNYRLKFNVPTSMTNPGTIIKHLYITELILYP